jgi:hypothetical protein
MGVFSWLEKQLHQINAQERQRQLSQQRRSVSQQNMVSRKINTHGVN